MRVIGIDIGAYSIKAVEYDTSFGKFEIHDYHEVEVRKDQDPIEAVSILLKSLTKYPSKIAIALPQAETTFRNLSIPTKDKKAIQAAVGFELEDELPFNIQNAVYSWTTLSQEKASTDVHISVSLKRHLAKLISSTADYEIDPDLVTTHSWAFRTLLNKIFTPKTDISPVILVQIGKYSSSIYCHHNGSPVFTLEVPFGGDQITHSISNRFNIGYSEAEKAKLDNGFILTDSQKKNASREQIDFSNAISEALTPLVSEIRQASLSAKSETGQNVQKIYLSGSTATLPGLKHLISEKTHIRSDVLQALSSINPSGVTYSETSDVSFAVAAALGLCLVSKDRTKLINFRSGEFSKRSGSGAFNLQNLKQPLIAVGAILCTMIISFAIQSVKYEDKIKSVDQVLSRSIRSFFGDASRSSIRNYLLRPSSLKKAVKSKLDNVQEVSKLVGKNPKSPILLLENISKTIPKNIVVDLIEYQAGSSPSEPYSSKAENKVSLTFLVSSSNDLEKLKKQVDQLLAGVSRSKVEEGKSLDQKEPRLKVTFTGKPKESAYE